MKILINKRVNPEVEKVEVEKVAKKFQGNRGFHRVFQGLGKSQGFSISRGS